MIEKAVAVAITPAWCACTTGWAATCAVTVPLTHLDRKVPVLRLLLAPLSFALAVTEQVCDLLFGVAPAPHPEVLDSVGPWIDLDDVTAAL